MPAELEKLTSLEDALEEHIMYVMKMMGNSVQKTAPILGVSERTLQKRLKIVKDKTKFVRHLWQNLDIIDAVIKSTFCN